MLLVVLFGILFFIVWYYRSKTSEAEPPVMSGWLPLLGHAHRSIGSKSQMLKALMDMTKECEQRGGILRVYLGSKKAYGVMDPEDSLTIMNSCMQKHEFYDFAKPILGNGLLTADAQTWKTNRKLLNPAFSQRVLNGYIEIFNAQAERLVQQFAEKTGRLFDQEDLLRTNNLETICTTSLGLYATDPKYSEVIKQYMSRLVEVFDIVNDRMQKFWLYSDFLFNLSPLRKKQDEKIKKIATFSQLILQKNREERKLRDDKPELNKPRPFIDLILDLAEETGCFTDKEIEAEIETVVLAGHDTTATVMTFALVEIGSNMKVQEKAVEEINRVLGNSNKWIDQEDLAKLQYIDAIVKETLRLHVVLAAVPRHIDKDVKLKKYTLKANTDCFILIHGINRHKGLWGADADQFRPERWLEKDSLPDAKYFAAFGLGRRTCIGKTYAIMSMKILLAHILRSFQVKSDVTKMVKKMLALIRPDSGHQIVLTPRKLLC